MNKVLQLLSIVLFVAFAQLVYAQCEGRYSEDIFTDVSMTTVEYSPVTGFEMDIYQPVGDTYEERALIIFAHGGAFFSGSKENATMVQLCETYARKGFVTASIQYTLAPGIVNLVDSLYMIDIVVQAMGDSKAAIRYFRSDASGNNTYGIDPTQVWVGGNSAGGILMSHTSYLHPEDNVPQYLLDSLAVHGGWEGNRGHEGFSSEVSGMINLAGGLNQAHWLSQGDVPVVSAHGDADGTVAYDCNDVYWNDPLYGQIDLIDICGSSVIHAQADAVGVENSLLTFPGDDHVPWGFSTAKYDQVIQHVTDFVSARVSCNAISDIQDFDQAFVNIYPNPAKNYFTIDLDDRYENYSISMTDISGRVINSFENVNQTMTIQRSGLNSGLYMIKIQNDSETINRSIILH